MATKRNPFGRALRDIRKQTQWSQKECANKMGIHYTMWSHWECGVYVPSLPNFYMISQVLALDESEIALLVTMAGRGRI